MNDRRRRKVIQPRRPSRGGPAGRRMPPPPATGEESRYLHECKTDVTPMIACLRDGRLIRGWIEYFDTDMIKINRHEGPHLFVRKADIRYLVEDEGP